MPVQKHEFALIVCDIATQRIVVYEALEKEEILLNEELRILRVFLGDYLDYFKPVANDAYAEPGEWKWTIDRGLAKSFATTPQKSGIHVAFFVDYLTQQKCPLNHCLTESCSEKDLFEVLALQLVFGRLINF